MPRTVPDRELIIRTAETDADLTAWVRVRRIVVPDQPAMTVEQLRAEGDADRLLFLLSWNDDDPRAENGLTVVDRAWRGRGLATALKRRQLAWASAAGLRELVTWTQMGNEAMQRVNLRLGYVTRSISRSVRRELA